MSEARLISSFPPALLEARTRPVLAFRLQTAAPNVVGQVGLGERRVVELTGGVFESPHAGLAGEILPGGSDWQTVRHDGVWMINVRAVLRTFDGELITMSYEGLRHGPAEVLARLGRGEPADVSEYYLRVTPYFETASERFGFLNRIVSFAIGHRLPEGPVYNVFEVL